MPPQSLPHTIEDCAAFAGLTGAALSTMSEQAENNPQADPVPAAWQKTEMARHGQRPDPYAYIERLFTDFSEIHGDRAFGDDPAMTCGMARFEGEEEW